MPVNVLTALVPEEAHPETLGLVFSLPCTGLENPRDGGAWWAAIYGVAQGQTRLKRLSSSILV